MTGRRHFAPGGVGGGAKVIILMRGER